MEPPGDTPTRSHFYLVGRVRVGVSVSVSVGVSISASVGVRVSASVGVSVRISVRVRVRVSVSVRVGCSGGLGFVFGSPRGHALAKPLLPGG